MSSEDANKAVVRQFYAAMDAGNLEAMDQLVAEDYICHNPPPFPGLGQGRAGLKLGGLAVTAPVTRRPL